MIIIKNSKELDKMIVAGQAVAKAFAALDSAVADGVTTLELDRIAAEAIKKCGGRPSFKNYRGYPKNICVSINNVVIHGIPDKTRLKNGDIVSIDIGAYIDGYHGDSAKTYAVGDVSDEARKLIDVTEQCFWNGIEFAKEGNRLQDISATIQKTAEDNGFSAVEAWIGHGIGKALHEDPEIPNVGKFGHGPRLYRGMTLAVEPMINAGSFEVYTAPDGWTIKTQDGSLSAHYEHTIAVTKGEPLVLTRLQ